MAVDPREKQADERVFNEFFILLQLRCPLSACVPCSSASSAALRFESFAFSVPP
jgi:hypothetical protein